MKSEESLQKRQLHLQAMLTVVSLRAIGEDAVPVNQFPGRLAVYPHLSQRCSVIVGLAIHGSPVEPLMMTGTQQKNPLKLLVPG